MVIPFEAWSARAQRLARPFSENPFRLLEALPGDPPAAIDRAAAQVLAQLAAGQDIPRMVATGPVARTAEQVQAALEALRDPARTARAALFVPWLRRLPVDGEALPAALELLSAALHRAVTPAQAVAPLARRVLPPSSPAAPAPQGPPDAPGPRFFPGDVDLAQALGPPTFDPAPSDALDGVGRAPARVANAVLSATRLGKGRRLHMGYLRALLAEVDGGDAAARRRLRDAGPLFDQIQGEPGAPLVLGWRDFLDREFASAERHLARGMSAGAFTERERGRAQALSARIACARGEVLPRIDDVTLPEACWVRGAVALADGTMTTALPLLERAWTDRALRPRASPLFALALLADDQLDAAERVLRDARAGDVGAAFARAYLRHARGELGPALDAYRAVLERCPGHRGARFGVAALSADLRERAQARARLAPAARHDPGLTLALLELALADGAMGELARGVTRLDEADPAGRALKIQLLDKLGRRAQSWALRGEREERVRDAARAALERGDALGALGALAGISLADPLRRRAARQAVVAALAAGPTADPDAVVERVLGRVSEEELALLDLPAHLYRAVRQLEAHQPKRALASLRKYLDSGEDALAAALFAVLSAPAGEAWPAAEAFLDALLGLADADADARLASGDAAIATAALLACAAQGRPAVVDLSSVDGAAALAAGLCGLRAGLLAGDHARCAAALHAAQRGLGRETATLERAARALVSAQFADAVLCDPELALRGLEQSEADDPIACAHDVAVWRHVLAIAADGALDPAQLAAVVQAWTDAGALGGWVHPGARADPAALRDALLTELVALLGAVRPDSAEATRAALEALEGDLAPELLARAGWRSSGRARPRKARR